jgi:sec-independent protein translocase protein TatC
VTPLARPMVEQDARLTLMEHLGELRSRLIRSAIAVVVGITLAVIFQHEIFKLLLHPLPKRIHAITTFSPAEPFMVSLKVWMYASLIFATPFLIYQFWAFVGPAFSPKEKKYFVPVVAACTLLFLFGVTFGYLLVLPKGLNWLFGFNSQFFNVQARAADYFSFVALFLLVFGLVFELPVIIVLSVTLGIVDIAFLRKYRRHAILINALIAAIATPSQDAFSMIAMLIPLLILYEASIWVAKFITRKKGSEGAESERNDNDKPSDDSDLSGAPA